IETKTGQPLIYPTRMFIGSLVDAHLVASIEGGNVKCWFLVLVTTIIFFTVSITSAVAQTTATITGRVEDSERALISGAIGTGKSVEAGLTRVVTAVETGSFRDLSLPVGKQEIKAEKTNFKTAIRSGIDLDVGQEVVVNFRLEVGVLLQEVRIVAEVPIV